MGSANRGLISWSGLGPSEAVRFLSIDRMTDFAITCFRSRKLTERRNLCWHCGVVGVRSAHDGPRHSCRLVRQGDCCNKSWLSTEQRHQPGVSLGLLRAKQHCVCAVDEQAAEITVPSFANSTEARF